MRDRGAVVSLRCQHHWSLAAVSVIALGCGGPDFTTASGRGADAAGWDDRDNTPFFLPPDKVPAGAGDGGDASARDGADGRWTDATAEVGGGDSRVAGGGADATDVDGERRDAAGAGSNGGSGAAMASGGSTAGSGADATVEASRIDATAGGVASADAMTKGQGPGDANANGPGSGDATLRSGEGGAIAGSCAPGSLSCDGGCVLNDVHHCGACDQDCTSLAHVSGSVACTAGACAFAPAACAPGWADCNGAASDGCEVDLAEAGHCGSCTVVCSGGTPLCGASAGAYACTSGCPASMPTLCGAACLDTTSSVSHCGSCTSACTTSIAHAQPACVGGSCTYECNPGYSACAGGCVDEQSDTRNCGGCGSAHACPVGMTCQAGACGCPSGTHDCGGTCADSTAVSSCGTSCNSPCPGPSNGSAYGAASCDGVNCGVRCIAAYSLCGNTCVDEQSDGNNCGGCAAACPAGTACVAGACQCNTISCPSGCCSGKTCVNQPVWYQDADGDGYGNPSAAVASCARPNGYVADNSDCCDADSNAHAGQTAFFSTADACGSFDYNCDGASTPQPNQLGPTNCGAVIVSCDPSNSCAPTCASSCGTACAVYLQVACGTAILADAHGCTQITVQAGGCTTWANGGPVGDNQACN